MVSAKQKEKAEHFLQMHHDDAILVLANSWVAGSSKLIEACGFKAVATTSMGIAASYGYPDQQIIQLPEMLTAITQITQSVQVPVTADIEAGYGDDLAEILTSVKKIIATGVAGINIEDSDPLRPGLVDEKAFCERIAAIRTLSNALGFHLVINVRTDAFYSTNHTHAEKLTTSIRRGNMYAEAGADCIFVMPVGDTETIATLVQEIDAPVNILANPGIGGIIPPTIQELQDLGVARVSLGSSIMKATLAMIKKVADELSSKGTFGYIMETMTPLEETALAYSMATGGV